MKNNINDELEIYKSSANMQYQKNVAAILGYNKGGQLILTDKTLIFIAHSLNIGQKKILYPLTRYRNYS